ncbi:CDP-alcohol phosphatidyltransferase family protein [bacterium]|nr:CDP-alcohol phosphatidyltransferase family protein [bacterium]
MEKRNHPITAPNVLSFMRILLIPFFLGMIFRHKSMGTLIVFLLAGLTDVLDGFTARVWKQKSKIGAYLDPAGDKLLMTSAFIVLSFPSLSRPNPIPFLLTLVVVGRDVLIVLSAFIIHNLTGKSSFPPSLLGKASTICQMGVLFLVLLFNYLQTSPIILNWVYGLALVLTLLSGMHYGLIGYRMITGSNKEI